MAQSNKRVLPLAVLFVAVSGTASAQRFDCTEVRRGDTAARLALRLTNNAENRHAVWFQIVDPTTSRFVSKAAYDTILPGWRVCLATDAVPRRGLPETGRTPTSPRTSRGVAPFVGRFATVDLADSWIIAVMILTPFLGLPVVKKYLNNRRKALDWMTGFAVAFVREFARPLPRRHPADRPIRATLHCAPYRRRLDILLAPTEGHTYPNVSDHKKNLSYDIERVLRLVPAQSFVCGEPFQRGDWVVIPFQGKSVVLPQEGAL